MVIVWVSILQIVVYKVKTKDICPITFMYRGESSLIRSDFHIQCFECFEKVVRVDQ